MNDTNKPTRAARRGFLKHVAVAGGAATVAGGVVAAEPENPEVEVRRPESKSYRVTPHIAKYYRSARI